MKKFNFKKLGIIIASIFVFLYIMFLLLPLLLNPIINGYSPQIINEIHKNLGLDSKIGEVKLITTPKLTVGLNIINFELLTPNNEQIIQADDFKIKLSLIPILARKIELDAIQLKKFNAYLLFDKNGELDLLKYLPEQKEENKNSEQSQNTINELPLGFKLSNHLPNISLDEYNITLTDGNNNYVISGKENKISDFILNKKVKIKSIGSIKLKDKEQFKYNIEIVNKIMPQIELNDLIFNPQINEEQNKKEEISPINIIKILEGLYYNNVTANIDAKLTTELNNSKGNISVNNLSVSNLPPSNINLKINGNFIDINSEIYTQKNEVSKINGKLDLGKNPNIDMNLKSNLELSNLLKIIKDIALIFDIKDLQTLTANGKIDANFNIKSNMKTVKSNGYLKIPSAKLYYGLYKIGVDNINADVKLANNNINIENLGFSVLNQPLKIYGTIKENSECDIHLTADKLNLKGLLVAFGQASLMKDNNINSGLISMFVDITGTLNKINPVIKVDVEDINIKNTPSNTQILAPKTEVNITTEGTNFIGNAKGSNIKINNPAAKVSVPNILANINQNEIEITNTPFSIEKINLILSGKIKDYLQEKMSLDFITEGDIKSNLKGEINNKKQTLNLNYFTREKSSIIIPMFDKSKMDFTGNIAITGKMINPLLKGHIEIPVLNIPEIPVSIKNMSINLNGQILNGNATVEKFTSGGIEAVNIVTNFSMKGENFYLKNLKGDSFGGKISGDIIYNLTNANTDIKFTGSGMNAEKATFGATGIKKALDGTLDFDADLNLKVADYDEMMKSMKGNILFNIKNGSFGTIGRLENYLQASNIISNTILKTTVATITSATWFTDTAKFSYLNGKLSFLNGYANIEEIKSSGPSLAYFISGKYNLLNGYSNINVLGRLDGQIVAKLGPIGELSTSKLLSYIPKFGNLTSNIVKAMTQNPKTENIAAIPNLSTGSTSYKDFKVTINGTLGKTNAIKSFKWLTEVDTSAIETKTVKETFNDIKTSVSTDLDNTVKSVNEVINNSKEQWNVSKEQLKTTTEELKNLFKF